MTFNWGEVKDEIERLYMRERKSLDEVRDILKENRNFNPSVRAYKDKFEEWGYKKYKRRRNEPTALSGDLVQDLDLVQTTEIASALLANSESESIKAHLVQAEQELELLASEAREQQIILSKVSRKRRRPDLEPDIDEIKHSIRRVAQLQASITQMRRKNEIIMASVSFQTCGPTGFASCWKQAPMTLEDAHGKLLPLPLELVVSWEMFDSILLSHFRKLAGEKKVEKREYEIEDGSTRGTLARTTSWSQICKPGRKIEMSMIFKEANKTGVACPKCDTISNEKKGVQVECSNPDCKMIFRTEDDENGVYADEESRQKRHLSMLGRVATMSSSPTEQERAFDDKPDDLPGMFKRVIIRLLSVKEPSSDSKLQDRMDLKSQEFTPRFRALVQWYQENGVLWIPNQKTGVSSSVESQNRVTATPAAFDEWYMEIDEPYLPKNWKGISDVDNSMKARPLPNLPGSHFEYDSVHMSNIVSPLGQPLDILPMDLFDSIFWDMDTMNNSDQLHVNIPDDSMQTISSHWSANEMWWLPPVATHVFQNVNEEDMVLTAEGVTVGGMDLLDYMTLDFNGNRL